RPRGLGRYVLGPVSPRRGRARATAARGRLERHPAARSPVMNAEADLPLRVMALHALTYCERLFFLEEVEEIRVADEAVYAGRTLHEQRSEPDPTGTEWRNFALSSETLGLVGRVDAVRQ